MGQYYVVVNVDKRERLEPFDFGCGMKLMEWSYERNPLVIAMMNLMEGRWAADRVLVIGDYADDAEPSEPCHTAVVDLMAELKTDCLFSWAQENCRRIIPRARDKNIDRRFVHTIDDKDIVKGVFADTNDPGFRSILNYVSMEYVDLEKCPIEEGWYDDESGESGVMRIAPISLLLAMGNGRGGGDFCGRFGGEFVGEWCKNAGQIHLFRFLPDKAMGWTEFNPDFSEKKELIPYTEKERVAAEAEKAWQLAHAS